MKKINKNSRSGIVNLLADFILTRIDQNENSTIQVTDCTTFFVINGQTTSQSVLDIDKIKNDFMEWFGDILKDVGIDKINTIDLIQYGQDVKPINQGWVNINKDVFVQSSDELPTIAVMSEFPYGYSLNCGRSMVYYSHYIFNHMFNLLNVRDVKFYFTNEMDSNDDLMIDVICDSKINNQAIKSLILDVFSFDLTDFNKKIIGYDLLQDILFPGKEKPYLRQDMLEHVVLL